MARITRYLNELAQAKRMAASTPDFTRLLRYTALFHLGNRFPFFNSNEKRQLHCMCNRRGLVIEFRQNTGDLAVLYEVIGSAIYRAPYEALDGVRTVVDLGAHIGLATLYFATLFPGARVVSVEPMLDNFELLQRNCRANGIGATLVNKCIGRQTGEVELYRDHASHMHTIVRGMRHTAAESTVVRTITMTDLLSETAIDEVDILKVDIEGGEGELFAQCGAWISNVRAIIMEVHPGVVDYAGVIHSITTHGFGYYPPGQFAPLYDVFLRRDVAEQAGRQQRLSRSRAADQS